MLLVVFCGMKRLEQPTLICDLADVTNLGQGQDTMLHDNCLSHRPGCSSVDDAFVIFYWNKDTPFIKYQLILTGEIVNLFLEVGVKVG
jgi:hypothetical protein